ncbi:MAG: hypothetical protein ACM3PP_00060 [Candidatus Saccharibacteria bacterium]
MFIKAEDNEGWTIADELKYNGDHIDGVYFNRIEINIPGRLDNEVYTIDDGKLDLGTILKEAFGDSYIQVVDVDSRRIFRLA